MGFSLRMGNGGDVLSCPSLDKPEAFGYHGECFPADTLSDAAILTCRSKPSAAKVRRRTTCLAFWRLLAFANPRLAKGSKGPVWDGPVHFLGTDNQKKRGLQELVFRLCFNIFFSYSFFNGGLVVSFEALAVSFGAEMFRESQRAATFILPEPLVCPWQGWDKHWLSMFT